MDGGPLDIVSTVRQGGERGIRDATASHRFGT